MFTFDPNADIDLDYFEYQLRQGSTSGTLINSVLSTDGVTQISGTNKANVFTVSVANSNSSTTTSYFGRVRTVSTSGARSAWSNYDGSGDTPLIASQYIQNLTADKIAAGEISSASIVLGGASPANSIIKSKTYDDSNGTQGWLIKGDGTASIGGQNGINYIPSVGITLGSNVTIDGDVEINANEVEVNGSNASQILRISESLDGGNSGLAIGTGGNNYWYTNGNFRVGGTSNYAIWNGSTLSIVGQVTASSGNIGGWNINPSSIRSANNLVTLNSNGLFEIGTASNNKATITSDGDFTVYGSDGGSGYGVTRMYGGFFNVKSGSDPAADVANTQVTHRNIGFFKPGSPNYGVFISGGNDNNNAFIDVGATGRTDAGSVSASGPVYAGANVYLQSSGTIAAASSFSATGSSTTARLASGTMIAGYDAVGRASSLRELKENIQDIENALEILQSLRPRKYNFKADAFTDIDPSTGEPWTDEAKAFASLDHKYGFIVEEVLEVRPDLISYTFDSEGEQNPNYLDFSKWKPTMWEDIDVLVLCVKSIQELSTKIDELESRLV